MRRLAWCALALAAACGSERTAGPAPLDQIRLPTGIAVHHGRVLVVSSNSDLLYDEATGGVLADLDVSPTFAVSVAGAVAVHSMGGELAIARDDLPAADVPDAEACGGLVDAPLALFGNRGVNTVNAVSIGAGTGGALSCAPPGAACGIPVNAAGFGDPFAVTVACGGGRARAYFGYMNAKSAAAWVGELNLRDDAYGARFTLRNANLGAGPVLGFAYDRDRDRLFMTGAATGTPTPLRWANLAGCTFGATGPGGCTVGSAALPVVGGAYAVELHGIALAPPAVPGVPRAAADPIRAYLSGVVYDQASAASTGYRTTALGSVLVVVDLFDDALGGVTPQLVAIYDLPAGAQDVRVLPRPAGWPATRRDVVAVVSVDAGALTIIDDETSQREVFGLDATGPGATGAPVLGHQTYGLGVDPAVAGSTARLWVGSWADSFVTPVDVTLDPTLAATFAGGSHVKLTGATP